MKGSSAKILHIEINPSGRSFVQIKNNGGPNTDPCRSPEFIFHNSDVSPFETTP